VQDQVVNTYLAKVFDSLPPALARRTLLFTTFFMSKLLDTMEPPLQASIGQLMGSLQYMNVQR
jgi:hypothetical protein